MNKAVILDRDGVINEDGSYLYKPEDICFRAGIFDFCRKAKEKGYLLIVATNQSGIARGYYTEDNLLSLNCWMIEQFQKNGVVLDKIYYCPFHPEKGCGKYKADSYDRKPNPGMFLKAQADFGLEMVASLTIGDKDSDMEAGRRAGVGKLLLLPGKYGYTKLKDVVVVSSLLQACAYL